MGRSVRRDKTANANRLETLRFAMCFLFLIGLLLFRLVCMVIVSDKLVVVKGEISFLSYLLTEGRTDKPVLLGSTCAICVPGDIITPGPLLGIIEARGTRRCQSLRRLSSPGLQSRITTG